MQASGLRTATVHSLRIETLTPVLSRTEGRKERKQTLKQVWETESMKWNKDDERWNPAVTTIGIDSSGALGEKSDDILTIFHKTQS